MLEDAGAKVRVVALDLGVLLKRLDSGDFELAILQMPELTEPNILNWFLIRMEFQEKGVRARTERAIAALKSAPGSIAPARRTRGTSAPACTSRSHVGWRRICQCSRYGTKTRSRWSPHARAASLSTRSVAGAPSQVARNQHPLRPTESFALGACFSGRIQSKGRES